MLYLIEALSRAYQITLSNHPDIPELYKSGIRYIPDTWNGIEHWDGPYELLAAGGGDCKKLAAWRIAEYRNKGCMAMPYITYRRTPRGNYIYHALVRMPSGRIEDPSRYLGMGPDPGKLTPYPNDMER